MRAARQANADTLALRAPDRDVLIHGALKVVLTGGTVAVGEWPADLTNLCALCMRVSGRRAERALNSAPRSAH